MANVKFGIVVETLTDNSEVADVVLYDQDGDRQLLFNAPSKRVAFNCAESLNDVLNAFMLCGSDFEALRLAVKVTEACKK